MHVMGRSKVARQNQKRKGARVVRGKTRKIVGWIVGTFGVSLVAIALLNLMLPCVITWFGGNEEDLLGSCIEAAVAALSAGFVAYQLISGQETEKHQVDVEKAEFVLKYNQAFIENERLTNIEKYLETMLTKERFEEIDLRKHRQDLVNYLVHLEGFASCIHSGVLDFDNIDNLFAYRFFLAMNHPKVQDLELIPYATYYQGCYQLYDKWLEYRMLSGKYSAEKSWDIPLCETMLCYHEEYEKYACPDLVVQQVPFMKEIPRKNWRKALRGFKHEVSCAFGKKHEEISDDLRVCLMVKGKEEPIGTLKNCWHVLKRKMKSHYENENSLTVQIKCVEGINKKFYTARISDHWMTLAVDQDHKVTLWKSDETTTESFEYLKLLRALLKKLVYSGGSEVQIENNPAAEKLIEHLKKYLEELEKEREKEKAKEEESGRTQVGIPATELQINT